MDSEKLSKTASLPSSSGDARPARAVGSPGIIDLPHGGADFYCQGGPPPALSAPPSPCLTDSNPPSGFKTPLTPKTPISLKGPLSPASAWYRDMILVQRLQASRSLSDGLLRWMASYCRLREFELGISNERLDIDQTMFEVAANIPLYVPPLRGVKRPLTGNSEEDRPKKTVPMTSPSETARRSRSASGRVETERSPSPPLLPTPTSTPTPKKPTKSKDTGKIRLPPSTSCTTTEAPPTPQMLAAAEFLREFGVKPNRDPRKRREGLHTPEEREDSDIQALSLNKLRAAVYPQFEDVAGYIATRPSLLSQATTPALPLSRADNVQRAPASTPVSRPTVPRSAPAAAPRNSTALSYATAASAMPQAKTATTTDKWTASSESKHKVRILSDVVVKKPTKPTQPQPNTAGAKAKTDAHAAASTSASTDSNSKIDAGTKRPRYPPLVVEKMPNWIIHFKALKQALGHIPNARPYGKGVRFTPTTEEEYRVVQRYLANLEKEENISWFSYSLPAEKSAKFCIRGLPLETEPSKIEEELRSLGFTPEFVRQIRARQGRPGCIHFAQMQHTPNLIPAIYNITELLCMPGVRIEAWRGKKGPAQCHRCQQFRHSSHGCHRKQACVRCGEAHAATDCARPREEPPTCANCGGPHPANSVSCPVFHQEAKIKRAGTTALAGRPLIRTNSVPAQPATPHLMAESNDGVRIPRRKRKGKKGALANQEHQEAVAAPAPQHKPQLKMKPKPTPRSTQSRLLDTERAICVLQDVLGAIRAGENAVPIILDGVVQLLQTNGATNAPKKPM